MGGKDVGWTDGEATGASDGADVWAPEGRLVGVDDAGTAADGADEGRFEGAATVGGTLERDAEPVGGDVTSMDVGCSEGRWVKDGGDVSVC